MNILKKLPEIILLIILFFLIAKQADKSHDKISENAEISSDFSIDNAKEYFINAKQIEIKSVDKANVFDENGEILGCLLSSSPVADNIVGYASKVPILIAIDKSECICGIKLLENNESKGFVRRISRKGFFNSWDKMPVSVALASNIDAISGATMTSSAVKEGLELRLSKYLETEQKEKAFPWEKVISLISALLVIILALFSFFFPKKLGKKRLILLIVSISILGFWQGELISLALMYGWLINGIPLMGKLLMIIILLLSFLLPFFTSKAFYCAHLCPFGAAQELISKTRKSKFRLPYNLPKYLKYFKMIFFYTVVIATLFRYELDLSSYEPFAAFMLMASSAQAIVLASVFLIVSIFVPKAWCRFFCPTGYLLEVFRKSKL